MFCNFNCSFVQMVLLQVNSKLGGSLVLVYLRLPAALNVFQLPIYLNQGDYNWKPGKVRESLLAFEQYIIVG